MLDVSETKKTQPEIAAVLYNISEFSILHGIGEQTGAVIKASCKGELWGINDQ